MRHAQVGGLAYAESCLTTQGWWDGFAKVPMVKRLKWQVLAANLLFRFKTDGLLTLFKIDDRNVNLINLHQS